jgi:hypothetical protein
MFDLLRALAMLWGTVVLMRARAWVAVLPLALAAWLLGLAVASGITVRNEGPLDAMMAIMLAIIGPSAIPRGHLPAAIPLASLVTSWPLLASLLAAAALVIAARWLGGRLDAMPQASEKGAQLERAVLALWLVAGSEGLSAGTRAVLYALDRTTSM